MTAPLISIELQEWRTIGPDQDERLKGKYFEDFGISPSLAEKVGNSRLLRLSELRTGLEIGANSYVGRIHLGQLSVTVRPKIKAATLLALLRYAYGFRKLKLIELADLPIETFGFEDLLVSQLIAETEELISRGLAKTYVRRDERLSSPRGKIDVQRLAAEGGAVVATLPCQHYPRIENNLLNRTLLAGLKLAGGISQHLDLRREARRLASQIEEHLEPVVLSASVLDRAERQINRLTKTYAAAMSIIRLLYDGQGVLLEGETQRLRLPGFLFDMNGFFQALVSRFLQENLTGYEILDEQQLHGMMRYRSNFVPARKSPTPRPDYLVRQRNKVKAILDAKYRDIWERDLPREMLYQLVVYAVSHQSLRRSAILYPSTSPAARETCVVVSDPHSQKPIGEVALRNIDLEKLRMMVEDDSSTGAKSRSEYAEKLAFGEK